ncbi:MAG: YheU family protein [Steroidobacteraceae bacterium]
MTEWYEEEQRPPPVSVPHTDLSAEALRGVVESFVLREGTDYGDRDVPHEQKVAQVLRQLERREAQIMFDPVTSTVDIVVVPGGPGSTRPA